MAVKGFTCYLTYYQSAMRLPDEQRGLFWEAVMDYMFSDIDREDDLPYEAQIAFIYAKSHLKTSLKQSENAAKKSQKKPNGNETKPNEAKTQQVKEKDQDKEKDKGEPQFGIPDDAKAALIDLGLMRGDVNAQ